MDVLWQHRRGEGHSDSRTHKLVRRTEPRGDVIVTAELNPSMIASPSASRTHLEHSPALRRHLFVTEPHFLRHRGNLGSAESIASLKLLSPARDYIDTRKELFDLSKLASHEASIHYLRMSLAITYFRSRFRSPIYLCARAIWQKSTRYGSIRNNTHEIQSFAPFLAQMRGLHGLLQNSPPHRATAFLVSAAPLDPQRYSFAHI